MQLGDGGRAKGMEGTESAKALRQEMSSGFEEQPEGLCGQRRVKWEDCQLQGSELGLSWW